MGSLVIFDKNTGRFNFDILKQRFLNKGKLVRLCNEGVLDKVEYYGIYCDSLKHVNLVVYGDILKFLKGLDWGNIFNWEWLVLEGSVYITFEFSVWDRFANRKKVLLDVAGVVYNDAKLFRIEYSLNMFRVEFVKKVVEYSVWFTGEVFDEVLSIIKRVKSLRELVRAVSLLYLKNAGVSRFRRVGSGRVYLG